MEVGETGRKKISQNVGHHDLVGPKRNQHHYAKSIEENEKMVEEMQQQMLKIEKDLMEKTLLHEQYISGLEHKLRYRWRPIENDPMVNFRSNCPKKMELDKLTFANNAYRDKKAVISFSSGEREINIHNLKNRMLHGANCMNDERRLLKMLNPNKVIDDAGFSLAQVEEQMLKLYMSIPWPNNISTSDGEIYKRKLRELEYKRDQVFVNAPSKASLWNLLPSTKDLRNQIQAMEARDEEKMKKVLERRKKIESRQRKIKKAENDIKSMRKMMERIGNRKQKALETISYERSCLEKITIL